jgi:hypothetical protein
VRIELPDGRVTRGRITKVGKVAVSSGQDGGSKVTVTIRLTGKGRVTSLDQAPVTVDFAEAIARKVLAVPVTALVATAGGGYAVVLPGGRQVPVAPGLYANGYVEIEGRGLRRGLRVQSA